MIRTTDDFEAFKASALDWQRRLGLTDWTLHFRFNEGSEPTTKEATIWYGVAHRQANITFHANKDDNSPHLPPARTGLHELLHILLADTVAAAARRASEDHDDVMQEEHRVIERLLNALAPL
jgi:hypothetical protein